MGNLSEQRQRVEAISAYRMRQSGATNREIAAALGKDVEQVPGMIRRGERFADAPLAILHDRQRANAER